MKRILILAIFLGVGVIIHAQGWVVDEASKDDSGGIFSGIFGFILLLGVIWLIGNIIDKNKEAKENRKRFTNKNISSSTEVKGKTFKPQNSTIGQNNDNVKVEDKRVNDVKEQIPQKDSCYIYYRVIREKEYADIVHYSAIFSDGFAVESYAIKSEDIVYDNNEYHGANISNVREKGKKISKQEFEKWQNRIFNIKLKLEHLLPINKTPYGKEWKDGDYLYFPAGEILTELNKKYAEQNNIKYTEESADYQGPEFSLLYVTNADKDSPMGYHISVSEDFVSYDKEDDEPKSLDYFARYYDRVSLITKEDYENALAMIKKELKALMIDIKESINIIE